MSQTTYKITSLSTLETKVSTLDKLSRNLLLNSIVSCDGQPLGIVTHCDLVFFSRTWAGWVLECSNVKPPEALRALEAVDRWLQDPGSVSLEDLRAAAGAARAAARAAAGAARAAAWAAAEAAGAAEAAEAAEAAAGAAAGAAGAAAGAAAWAVRAAAGAAEAAEAAAGAAWAASYNKQGEFIIEHLKNSSQTSFPSSAA